VIKALVKRVPSPEMDGYSRAHHEFPFGAADPSMAARASDARAAFGAVGAFYQEKLV
jgi:hypothetical protein